MVSIKENICGDSRGVGWSDIIPISLVLDICCEQLLLES